LNTPVQRSQGMLAVSGAGGGWKYLGMAGRAGFEPAAEVLAPALT